MPRNTNTEDNTENNNTLTENPNAIQTDESSEEELAVLEEEIRLEEARLKERELAKLAPNTSPRQSAAAQFEGGDVVALKEQKARQKLAELNAQRAAENIKGAQREVISTATIDNNQFPGGKFIVGGVLVDCFNTETDIDE